MRRCPGAARGPPPRAAGQRHGSGQQSWRSSCRKSVAATSARTRWAGCSAYWARGQKSGQTERQHRGAARRGVSERGLGTCRASGGRGLCDSTVFQGLGSMEASASHGHDCAESSRFDSVDLPPAATRAAVSPAISRHLYRCRACARGPRSPARRPHRCSSDRPPAAVELLRFVDRVLVALLVAPRQECSVSTCHSPRLAPSP